MSDRPVPMLKYCLVFVAAWAIATLTFVLISAATGLKPNFGIRVGIFIAAVFFAADRFARDWGRPPTRTERLKLAGGTLLAVALAGTGLVVISVMVQVPGSSGDLFSQLALIFEELGLVLLLIAVAVFAIYFAIAYFCFGFFAKLRVRAPRS